MTLAPAEIAEVQKTVNDCASEISVERVIEIVCAQYRIDIEEFYQKQLKLREYRWAKCTAIHIMHNNLGMSPAQIKRCVGLTDHSTIYYRLRQVKELLHHNGFKSYYLACMQALYSTLDVNAHPIATYVEVIGHRRMTKDMIVQLNLIDAWLKRYGYQLDVKRKG